MFDRLFQDWTTIDGFQRTRGVLKLMAKVIYRLWSEDTRDLMILPGSLPLDDPHSRNELTYYLPPGWDAVIETDIDGERAAATRIEHNEPRFGQFGAARLIARTLFLGSAPASVAQKDATRGLDRARLLLGCLQPGQAASIYSDALGRVIDQARYLRTTGDPAAAETRYWFDTRANLRREMEDRKRRFDDNTEVRETLAGTLKTLLAQPAPFDGLHIFTPHADVPDDSALRLVVLGPEHWTARDEGRPAREAVRTYLKQHGDKPRYRANRLLFLAPDHGPLSRLKEAARTVLAWGSIVADIKEGRLNIDLLQQREAETALKSAQDVLPSTARECYKWLLGPLQENPTAPEPEIEAFPVPTSSAAIGKEIARICQENELIIETWSPIHLRDDLKRLYWRAGDTSTRAGQFFEDSLRYFYLPRLKNHAVFAQAITAGASSKDFFGFAYGVKADGGFEGFCFGHCDPVIDDSLLLIEPGAAAAYAATLQQPGLPLPPGGDTGRPGGRDEPGIRDDPNNPAGGVTIPVTPTPGDPAPTKPVAPRHFHGSADIPAASAKMHLVQLAEEVISQLCTDPNASVRVVLEISAEFPDGAGEATKRAVSENAKTLGMKMVEWE
ncbi:hypothetical protein [Thiorhodovibrio winogradskyi]|uniref:hypothetical protein n=1 Tax=Thiorhodovibrio winogradskyi TaxID=77007 RepID=UPI002E2E61FF|nr:hypothetical protein [Thiorhodovibrio winogradskyi]